MTPTDILGLVALAGSILLVAWWILDRIEDANAAARARLAHDVRARKRMNAVISMSDWSQR